MKNLTYFVWLMAISMISLTSCSKENVEEMETADLTSKVAPVSYTSIELEILDLVNDYRQDKGLSKLVSLDESSIQAASHTSHMVQNDEVCHHEFINRYEALVKGVSAKAVSENVAFGYRTADAVFAAWLRSDDHRQNIEGNHTHFGISVREGADSKLYFTNIFVRK